MHKRVTFTAVVSIFSLLLASTVFATGAGEGMEYEQKPGSTTAAEPAEMQGKEARILKASEVIGYTVKNSQGEELGAIKELVIDPQHGRIAYAVLSVGGVLGVGDKLVAVPWESLTPMPTEKSFSFNISKEKLEEAPGLDKDNWPDRASQM